MIVLTVLMCFASTSVFAQLKEVRGVQTRVVGYQDYDINYKVIGYNRHGFEFKNENNYTVWVECELHTNGYTYRGEEIKPGVYDTKSFTLNAGEVYVWKCGKKMLYTDSGPYGDKYGYDMYENYYVRYKAYKAE